MITAGAGLCMFELEYLGSYAAKKPEDWVQKDYIKKRIKAVQRKANLTVGKVPVLFTISAAGVKVTDRRGQVVLLANSLTQISYCSFVKEEKIFCFLSRESSRFEEVHQYVHLFTTSQSIVDELNENIINAFSAANSQGSTTPTASNSVAADNKPKRTESCKVKREKEGINRSSSLKFPDPTSSNEYTTPSIKHGDICKERKLHSPGSPGLPGDPNSSTGNKMLKHIVSTQVKLESNRGKNAESFSKTLLSVNERDRLYTPKSQQPIKQPNQSARRKSVQTVDQNSLHRKTGNANLRRSLSVETYATVQKTLQSPRVLITPATANDNLAYINDESSGSPDLPDSIYAALPQGHQGHQTMTHQPSALPPPVAFSDSTPNQNDLGASDAQQNYIDIDKPGTNNNNTDTMSFYSDNYVKASTLGCRSHKTQSSNYYTERPDSGMHSPYSCGSSGVSVYSLENEQMMGRPLPLTPPTDGYCIDSRPHTPLRYQNDSPFVTTSRAGTGSTNHTKRSFTKSPSSQLETQSADDKQRNAEELLKQVPWFQPKLNREEVLQKLSKEDLGSFIIRESSTHTSCFALSVKVPKFNNPSGIAHYIIHRTPSQGFKIKGLEKEWNNLSSLVIHHTIMPELLPCTLKVPPPPSLRRPSTTSRGSNSSRGSSSPSPSLISKPTTPNQPDRIIHSLDKKFTVHEAV